MGGSNPGNTAVATAHDVELAARAALGERPAFGHRLRTLVLVVGKGEIAAAAVKVEAVAEDVE